MEKLVVALMALFMIILFIVIFRKNKKLKLLDLQLKNEKYKLNQIEENLKQTRNLIDNLKKEKNEKSEKLVLLSQKIDIKNNEIIKLKQKINTLEQNLSFYTEMKSDSLKLNSLDQDKVTVKEKYSVDQLNEEQKEILELMNKNDNLVITGKAGSGKSYLLNCFNKITNKKVIYINLLNNYSQDIKCAKLETVFKDCKLKDDEKIVLDEKDKELLKNIDTIVIDEVSILRSDVLSNIDRVLKKANSNKLVFGGKQLILIGDLFSFYPNVDKEEAEFIINKYGSVSFYNSNKYSKYNFVFKQLNKTFKQDECLVELLDNVRTGNINKDKLAKINEHYVKTLPKKVIQIVPKKDEVDYINNKQLDSILGKEYLYRAEVLKDDGNILEKDFRCEFSLKLKVGALVMMITDDANSRWEKGSLGIVSGLSNKFIRVIINGIEYEVLKDTFNKYSYRYNKEEDKIEYVIDESISQYPVVLAYAITINDAYGLSLNKAVLNLSECFSKGQAYVALSRLTSLNGLYLIKKLNMSSIISNSDAIKFYEKIG